MPNKGRRSNNNRKTRPNTATNPSESNQLDQQSAISQNIQETTELNVDQNSIDVKASITEALDQPPEVNPGLARKQEIQPGTNSSNQATAPLKPIENAWSKRSGGNPVATSVPMVQEPLKEKVNEKFVTNADGKTVSNSQQNRSRQPNNPWGAKDVKPSSGVVNSSSTIERSSSVHLSYELDAKETPSQQKGHIKPRASSNEPARRRRQLTSVIPDSAVLIPIRRPDRGGTSGKTVEVYTNHFRVAVDDCIVNQYDVSVSLFGRNGKLLVARKDEAWETVQRIATRENLPVIWYDEGKNIYSKELLTGYEQPFQVTFVSNNEEKTFQLKINNLVRQENLSSIRNYISNRTLIRPHDSVRVLETLFKQRARNELIAIRNQYYNRSQVLDDLGDARGMASGFYQALFLTQMGITLNMNLTFACFYQPLNFIDFACKYLRKNIITTGLNDHEINLFTKMVENLQIETNHTGRKVRYRIRGFGRAAQDIWFTEGSDEQNADASLEGRINVAMYFQKKYRQLKYPMLPCIDATSRPKGRANWIPMECATVVDWQRSLKPLDTQQRALVSKKSIIKPAERYDKIMKIVDERNFESDPYLKVVNLRVDTSEMISLKARVLPVPNVKYRGHGQGEAVEQVRFGKWTIRNRFFTTRNIDRWSMIYIGPPTNSNIIRTVDQFCMELPKLLRTYGITLTEKCNKIARKPISSDIETAIREASQTNTQIAFVILNETDDQIYDYVKKCGNQRFGLVTQCISYAALYRNMGKLNMYVQNLSQKINAKLGCINGVVNLKAALSRPSNEDLFMFFGADVTHTTSSQERPSIAAVVGSRDPTNSLYAARLSEQYPKKGRFSIEIIKDLQTMVEDLLKLFSKNCGNRLPTKIVFYRDGVDDGQYQKVLDNEVKKIKDACRVIYENKSLPKLTFIVVKKRHNTRFFVYDGQNTDNVEAGTVIDQGITHPSQFDFFLCSQAALMGTSRPALYHVLHDENGFNSDEVQQLTYWLCHSDARCSKSVSIPAPVHYAHLAAYASRSFEFTEANTNEDAPDEIEDEEHLTIDDVKTKLVILNSKVADNMWFV